MSQNNKMTIDKIEIEVPAFRPDDWIELGETEEGEEIQRIVREANKRLNQYHYYISKLKAILKK